MGPSDAYYKTKRNLLIFVGCLLLSIFAGFKIVNNEQKISILPFQLERPEFLATILLVVVLFNLFQLSIQWAAQSSEVQANRFHRIDFISTSAIGGLSIFCYLGSLLWPSIQQIIFTFDSKLEWIDAINLGVSILAIATSALASLLAALKLEYVSKLLSRWLKRKAISEDEELKRVLLSGSDWMLNYNPKAPGRVKQISFDRDGSIGLGQNDNETAWRIRNGLLEILNSKNQVFSRFSYDNATNTLSHTNDEDTLSIRNQRIFSRSDENSREASPDAFEVRRQ